MRSCDEDWWDEDDEDDEYTLLPGWMGVNEPIEPDCLLDHHGYPIIKPPNPIGFSR